MDARRWRSPASARPLAAEPGSRCGGRLRLGERISRWSVEVGVVGVGGAHAEVRVDLAVPLADPRHDLGQPGEQRRQPVACPSRLVLSAPRSASIRAVRLLAVVPAGPAEQQGVVAVRAGAGVGDEPLLGHVELAAVAPVRRASGSRRWCTSAGRDVQPLAGRVLLALQVPGLLPLARACAGPTACTGSCGQVRDVLVGDDLRRARRPGRRPARAAAGPPTPRRRRRAAGRPAGSPSSAAAAPSALEPQDAVLAPVQQPGRERGLLLLLPRLGLPAPLALGPLDQPDVPVALDHLDPPRDDLPVRLRPVRRDLGDRRRPMPREPLRLDLAALPSAGPARSRTPAPPASAPERDPASATSSAASLVGEQPVAAVDVPVQLLLQRDHPPPDASCSSVPRPALSRRHAVAQTADGSTAPVAEPARPARARTPAASQPEAGTSSAWSR